MTKLEVPGEQYLSPSTLEILRSMLLLQLQYGTWNDAA
jgi:hypothetical protein